MKILSEAPEIDAKVIDDAVIINMLNPTYGKAFRDYAINELVPYISSLLKRVDLYCIHNLQNLKNCTREKGQRHNCNSNCSF